MKRVQEIDYNVDLMRSILWQYENSPNMVALARADQDYINAANSEFWESWERDVFNLWTANEFGLVVWSRILDRPITIREGEHTQGVWGFGLPGQDPEHQNKAFEQGGFGRPEGDSLTLDEDSARKMLILRWFSLTMRPTVTNINQILADLFGEGFVYAIDTMDMTFVSYFVTRQPDARTRRLLERDGVLPRPSTVKSQVIIQPRKAFGFGVHHDNFDRNSFGA